MRNVVIVAGCRTPIGSFGGAYKSLSALDLSIPVMKELVKRGNFDPALIDDCYLGMQLPENIQRKQFSTCCGGKIRASAKCPRHYDP